MKIKSITDIITNSSSECYQIKNISGISEDKFKEMWRKELINRGLLNKEGKCPNNSCLEDTLEGEIYSEENYLYLDYPYMCNVRFNIQKILEDWFGEGNVKCF